MSCEILVRNRAGESSFPSMKTYRAIVSVGVLAGTLFLSGCMAAMMPAMMLGHAAHKKDGAAHDQAAKSCDCEKPAASKADAPAAPAAESPPPQDPAHKH